MKPQRNPKGTHMTWTSEVPTCSKHHANERLKCQHVANTVQNGRQTWQHVAHTIQSGRWYAKMWQIPCKMTGSSSKLLQIQGKWHQEFEQKQPLTKKTNKHIFFTLEFHSSMISKVKKNPRRLRFLKFLWFLSFQRFLWSLPFFHGF